MNAPRGSRREPFSAPARARTLSEVARFALIAGIAALAASSDGAAQLRVDDLIMGGTPFQGPQGGIVVAQPQSANWSELPGLPNEVRRPAAVISDPFDRTKLYVASNDTLGGVQVYRVELGPSGATSAAPLLPSPLPEFEAVSVASLGEEILLLTRLALHRVPKAGGPSELVLAFPPQTSGKALATDGRRLFASITTREIYTLDLLGPATVGLFTSLPGSLGNIQDLAIDQRGDLLVADADPFSGSYLRRIDDATGFELSATRIGLAPPLALAHDALLDQDYVAGVAQGQSWIAVLRQGREVTRIGPLPHLPGSLDLVRTAPLYLTGRGCADSSLRVPHYDANGLPTQGNANYGLHLFQAPSGPTVLLLGARPSGARGFELSLGPGAPGCALEVLPDLPVSAFVPASGEITLYFGIPVDPSLAGGVIDTQWWSLDPAANALGLAASQRGTVIVE
ncbi:MAG: hypothetical protein JNM84_01940 [Planctomycetes bacterium]|nr:hypothetical protein [Planctomycetota bacterium]